MTARSKAQVRGRQLAKITGAIPAGEWMVFSSKYCVFMQV
jgi:hypothetical protein